MKKSLLILMACAAMSARGQIDLVAELPLDVYYSSLIYIDHGMPKVLVRNPTGFEVYNTDFTLYADVDYPGEPAPYLAYVTRSLFDCDTTQLEYLLWGDNDVRIIREDGTVLLFLEDYWFSTAGILGVNTTEAPVVSDETGSYIIFDKMNSDSLRMYHLCGQVPQALARTADGSVISGIMQQGSGGGFKIFPNPSADRIQLDYDLGGHSTGRVFLYGSTGSLVLEKRLGAAFDHIYLDISSLATGTYIAKITTDGGLVLTEKFVKVGL